MIRAISVSKKVKHLFFLLRRGKFKTLWDYMVWVLPLWHSRFLQKLILVDLLPPLGIEIYPPFIEIEPTTACNLKCRMCEHTYWNEPPHNMTFEEFKMIVDQFPKLKWIGLTGIGSSFMNKDYLKMIHYLRETSSPWIEVIDHFHDLNEERACEIIDLEVDIIFISTCGATKETYEKLMVGSNFDNVMRNLRNFIRLKKEKKTRLPILNFHYIVSKENFHEMIPFVELIRSLDADEFEVLFTPLLHSFKEIEEMEVALSDDLVKEVLQKGKKLGIHIEFAQSVTWGKPPMNQCALWIMPFIFATGHVIPCCVGNEANKRDFQKRTALGNVFEKPFREIWYGQDYKNFKKMLRTGKTPPQCLDCCVFDTAKSK